MICYLNTSPAAFDGRLKKYFKACSYADISFFSITWDRLLSGVYEHNEYSYKRYAPFGFGHRLHNFIALIGWYIFAFNILVKKRKDYKIIHACNLVTIIVAFPMKVLYGKKIIFDIFDTSGKKRLERFFIRHSDMLILPHEKRMEQIGIEKRDVKCFLEVENVPLIDSEAYEHKGLKSKEIIRLSYVGTFERINRGLENVLNLVMNDERFIWEVAGSGDNMNELFTEAAKKCNRIIYHGRVLNEEGIDIMRRSDFIVALYYLTSPGHLYASPNKVYESLCLSVPVITSKDTLAGNQVESYNSGYVIEDSYEALVRLFSRIDDMFVYEYHIKEQNARNVWNQKYANYLDSHLLNKYLSRCSSLVHGEEKDS